MIKILYIDVNCKGSSTGDIVYSLHSQCIENSIDSAVCYGRGLKIKEHNVYKFGLDFETYLHALLTRLTGYTGCFSFFSTQRLIKFIDCFNPQIIHIHELHAYFVNVSKLLNYLKKKKIKTVFTNHCEFIYTGKCGHAKKCLRYSKQCGSCPELHNYPSSLFFDRTKNMLKTKRAIFENWEECVFVSPSQWLNSRIDYSFLKNKKRFVIHNGIDVKSFTFEKKAKSSNKAKTILSVAPNIMSDLKGGERIIKLARLFEGQNVEFVLVGDTNNYSKKIPSNVKIYPLVSNKAQLIDFYQKSDLFVICSSFENFPTTCIEAQCCGLPVCGFDVGGVSETILPGNGFTVEYGDINAMKMMIEKMLKSNFDRKSISIKSKNEFSNKKMFDNYLQLYKTLI